MVCSHRSHRLDSVILFEFEFDVELKMNFVLYMNFEMQMVLNRDKTRFLLLLPLNYNGPPGSSLSVVCHFFLNAS